MEYNINTKKENYHLGILKVVNCFLKMSNFELDIIVKMLDNDIKSITKETRKQIRDLIGDKSIANTNNYIKKLKDKNILILNSHNELTINNQILKVVEDGELHFKFNVN